MRDFVAIYKEIAINTATRFKLEIQLKKMVDLESYSFDKLMSTVMTLEKELTKKGREVIDMYKKVDQEENTDHITNEIQDILRNTIESFIKEL